MTCEFGMWKEAVVV